MFFFSEIEQETSPSFKKYFAEYLSNSIANSMFLQPVDSALVANATSKLKTKTSSGHD